MEEVGFHSAELCSSESELDEVLGLGHAWRTPTTSDAESDDVDHETLELEDSQYHLNVLLHALTGWLEKVDRGEVCSHSVPVDEILACRQHPSNCLARESGLPSRRENMFRAQELIRQCQRGQGPSEQFPVVSELDEFGGFWKVTEGYSLTLPLRVWCSIEALHGN
jgi:hypothetical protein